MKVDTQSMEEALSRLLLPEEKCVCMVYCIFNKTGLLARQAFSQGYAACTDRERLLTAKIHFGDYVVNGCALSTAKKLKVRKSLLGQYTVNAVFIGEKGKIPLKLRIAPKIVNGFPEQKQNLEEMVSILKKYEK